MAQDNRQKAYDHLIGIADKQGYITFDEIMDSADKYSLPIEEFDWLCNALTTRGTIVYDEVPQSISATASNEYYDFSQGDYEKVYNRIIELSPTLEPFVEYVRNIIPPQRGEINQLKYQVVDGNKHARSRMVEMHLRVALKIALQRAEAYDIDIEDTVGYGCIGLIVAVDKYNPDESKPFSSYAALWILQHISREQNIRKSFIHYPVYLKESYFSVYSLLVEKGCSACSNLEECEQARQVILNKLNCSQEEIELIISQFIQDISIEDIVDFQETAQDMMNVITTNNIVSDDILRGGIISEEAAIEQVSRRILCEDVQELLKKLKPREAEVLRLRYGLNGVEQTLEEIGTQLSVTRERIRQIESKSLEKLRIPSVLEQFKEYL